ncbi:MAG: hypothetical protein JSR26_08430 [Proteobacteria bacterium]|nr:hypothetical protein [Pseudomonadota bacterium]
MSYPGGWHPHIESALRLDLRQLFRKGALRPGCTTAGGWHWTQDGEELASIGYRATLADDSGTLTLDYSQTTDGKRQPVTCCIDLVSQPCPYGGRRWYFLCPYTHRRALKLYKWNGIEQFCHREAIKPKPTYASQRTGGGNRINEQRWALRRKLGDRWSDLFGEPCKPKGMRWRTFERYAARDAELAARDGVYLGRLLARMRVPGFD